MDTYIVMDRADGRELYHRAMVPSYAEAFAIAAPGRVLYNTRTGEAVYHVQG